MDNWDKLVQKERGLLEKEDELMAENRKLERVKAAYDEHLYETNCCMNEIGYMFHGNEERYKYEGLIENVSLESRKAYEQVESSAHDLQQEKRILSQAIEDVGYEKKKALVTEKEATHEY